MGWLAFGGNLETQGVWIKVALTIATRSKLHIAPAGLWLTLNAGQFQTASYKTGTREVVLSFEPSDNYTPYAYLEVEQPAKVDGIDKYLIGSSCKLERDHYIIPLNRNELEVSLFQE